MAINLYQRLRRWSGTIKKDVHALYLAARDPRVPWYVKVLALGIAAYALSPIDLIPDFIPVLGYLDDLVLLPPAILLVVWMIPDEVMAEHRAAAQMADTRPVSRVGAAIIIGAWVLLAMAAGMLLHRFLTLSQ